MTVGKKSYSTHVIDTEDNGAVKISMPDSGGLLKQEWFSLTIPQVLSMHFYQSVPTATL